ncbi:winged helix DNA-binding domain-containing protein [Aquihabitans sp. G128]|uniref:winged helix-turn-helix domain-containing protein n=1 Tax=Aquihabitans sp. G128 TaxID=2849779 RepID=UPI001C224239|nr:crosslink repair DNA glycosylase YcaQ family protein [Aquihabitans sp. G128]QXC63040.1 winged helix DNA-binding domain-containing protein [Aquihabitans sp. G128]
MAARPDELSLDLARRIALGAQGFARPRPTGAVDRRHGRKVLDHVGLIQIDSVNVLVRSQELPLFARLGHHRRDLIPQLTQAGDLFEYWGHEASHLPVALQPFLRWRMDDARNGRGTWGGVARIAREQAALVDRVLDQVRERKLTVGMLDGGGERGEGMWAWSPGKMALEYLFWSGQLTARRGPNFERWYDLPERALPAAVLDAPTPEPREAKKELLLVGARSHGVGTAKDLADYLRLNIPESRPLLAELVAEGRLLPVSVEGWAQPAFLHPEARRPRWVRGRALLSPFDSLVWERARTERIWGFRYRIEIYVPKPKRVHGYYVLPFLLDGELVARVDLKADRQAGRLLVQSAFGEDAIDVGHVVGELAAELAELARFLGLADGVSVQPRGDLAADLATAVTRARRRSRWAQRRWSAVRPSTEPAVARGTA